MDGLTQVLVGVHSIWRYVVLVTAFLAIGNMLMGFLEKRAWKVADARIGRYFVIAIDLEILFGVLIWLLQTRWDGADLLRSWRHPALMLLAALVAASLAWRRRVARSCLPRSATSVSSTSCSAASTVPR